MRCATASASRTALATRPLARARESGVSIVRLRETAVFERPLARLPVVAPGRWHLKGALALDFRLGPDTRATRDMDLGRADDEAATFAVRGVQPLPAALPPPPLAWEAPYRTLAREVGLPPAVAAGLRAVAASLDPLLAGELNGRARWDTAMGAWGSDSP